MFLGLPFGPRGNYYQPKTVIQKHTSAPQQQSHSIISIIFVLYLITGSLWFEIWLANDCQTESQQHIWSTLLHNCWNVVIVAEEYVTWTSC